MPTILPKADHSQHRAATRETAKQPLGAELWLIDQRPLSCVVTKLAHNHLIFVSLHDESPAPERNSHETPGKLIILGTDHDTPLAIPVRVNHHTRERWTLEPQQGALNLLVKLKALLQTPPQHSATTTTRLTPFRRSELFRDGQKILDDFLHIRFASFFSELDDRLLRAAATDHADQPVYQQAIAMVASQQEAFTAHYKQQVLALIAAAAQPDFVPQKPELSAATTALSASQGTPSPNLPQLAKQTATQNQAALDSITLHFSMVVRHLTDTTALPFGPAWLYRHFASTVTALQFPEATRHLLFQVFRDVIMTNIGPLYSRLDSFFCSRNSTQVAAHNAPPVLQQTVTTTDNDQRNNATTDGPNVKPAYPQPAYAGHLLATAGILHSALCTHPEDQTSAVLSELCNNLIDDECVHNEARPLLRQIKVALLALAGGSDEFWTNSADPARRCFGLITTLCRETWFRGGPVRRRLPSICERIQREWKINPGLFVTILPLLDDLLSRQQQASQRNRQRLAAKLDGQQRLRQAQRDVSTQLRQRFEGKPFPVALQQLIDQGWHQFMVHALVNQGPRSTTYQHALTTLEQLYQSLVGEPPATGHHQPPSSAAQLLAKLHQPLESAGLASVQYQQALSLVEALLRSPGTSPVLAADFRAATPSSALPHHPSHNGHRGDGHRSDGHRSDGLRGSSEGGSENNSETNVGTIPTLQPSNSNQAGSSDRGDEGYLLPLWPGEWLGWIDCPAEQAIQLAWNATDRSLHAFVDQAGSHLFDLSDTALATDRQLGLQRMADPWDILPLEDALYQLVARHFARLSTRFDQHYGADLLGPHTFEAELATLAKLAAYSGKTHTLIGVQLAPVATIEDTGQHRAQQPCDTTQQLITHVLRQLCPPETLMARLDDSGNPGQFGNASSPRHTTGHAEHQYYAILLPYTDVAKGQQLLTQINDGIAASQHQPGAPARSECGLLMVTQHSSPPIILLKQLQQSCTIPTAAGPSTGIETQRNWVPRLGQILQQNRLKLRVQGSVAIAPDQYNADHSHYEILLGILDDSGQISLPGELILAAEQHQRMDIIDRWVIQHTFQWLATHPDKATELGRIHINLSANALRSHPFLTYLLTELDQGSIPNDALSFEISATTASANLPRAADFIARVRHAGCHFALDHFGRGPDSLTLLRQLPVNMVKFDHTLSHNLVANSISYKLLAALTQAAHSLGISTCAQGVEHESVLASLEALEINYAQGFGVAKPMLLEEA